MDQRITLIKKVETITETGFERYSDQVVATVWASRESADSEKVVDDKVIALNVWVYQFRYHPDVAAENILDLILVDPEGFRFSIYSHEILGRKRYIKLKCQAYE